jgi:Heterokaryon incompatibility protein (HET)
MGSIYSQAVLVIAWLGREGENSEDAIRRLDEIAKHIVFRITQDEGFYQKRLEYMSEVVAKDSQRPFPLEYVYKVFQRPWWSRIWCLHVERPRRRPTASTASFCLRISCAACFSCLCCLRWRCCLPMLPALPALPAGLPSFSIA